LEQSTIALDILIVEDRRSTLDLPCTVCMTTRAINWQNDDREVWLAFHFLDQYSAVSAAPAGGPWCQLLRKVAKIIVLQLIYPYTEWQLIV